MSGEDFAKKIDEPAVKALELLTDGLHKQRVAWNKLYTYMKPFFDGDSDLKASAEIVNKEFSSIGIGIVVYSTAMTARMLAGDMFKMPNIKLDKIYCSKCGDKIFDKEDEAKSA